MKIQQLVYKRLHAFGAVVSGLLMVGVLAAFPISASAMAESYTVKEGESQIIKLDYRITRAMIASPSIATLKVLNKNELLLTGKAAGKTQLMLTPKNSD
ncbi:pilus assembly protein N-terminal domain-containing protein [Thiomicrorhabdus sp.]|uniref:pilus assembly protein N-terminal domain-containing protein n=1 Tax=Thiomicrorhabdus sp. TaxID=2039724 RepID=UPI0029C75DF5|nr:pilus assembly protein N-terminal domain-containing protein [Thiomicrorhabdus sp.]